MRMRRWASRHSSRPWRIGVEAALATFLYLGMRSYMLKVTWSSIE